MRVGSHHFSREFAREHRTLYVPHPVSLLALLNPSENSGWNRLRYRNTSSAARHYGIKQYTPMSLLSSSNQPVFNSTWVANWAHRLTWSSPKNDLSALDFDRPELLVLDTCYQSFWLELLKPKELIVRVADNPEGFGPYFRSGVRNAWLNCLHSADLVVAPTVPVADYLRNFGVPAVIVPNGVEIEHFQRAAEKPVEYLSASGSIAVYVGAIAEWLDFRLVCEVAVRSPNVDYFFIGPLMTSRLKNSPQNVHILGPRPYATIAGYYQHADVALVPFDVKDHKALIEGVDAIKVYEFLAASVPVVTTRWQQTNDLADHLYLADQTPSSFGAAIKEALVSGPKKVPEELLESWSWRSRFRQLATSGELDFFRQN